MSQQPKPQSKNLEEKVNYIVHYLVNERFLEGMEKKFATRDEIDRRFHQIITILDALSKRTTVPDEERLFQIHRIDRIEKELSKIKAHLGLK